MNICHTRPPTTAAYTVFSNTHGTFPMTDHVPGHKMSLSEGRRTETKAEVFFSCTGMKLEIDSEENVGNSKICGNYTLLKNQRVKETIRETDN